MRPSAIFLPKICSPFTGNAKMETHMRSFLLNDYSVFDPGLV